MPFTSRELAPLVEGVCAEVIAHEKELTELDRAIGDADHGLNMERGCKAVRERLPGWAELAPGALLSEAGKTLVMTVGGASGPLFGTLFMRLGQGLGDAAAITREGLVLALGEALVAVRARGRAQAGQKTLLDVLEPVYARLGEQPAVSLAAVLRFAAIVVICSSPRRRPARPLTCGPNGGEPRFSVSAAGVTWIRELIQARSSSAPCASTSAKGTPLCALAQWISNRKKTGNEPERGYCHRFAFP